MRRCRRRERARGWPWVNWSSAFQSLSGTWWCERYSWLSAGSRLRTGMIFMTARQPGSDRQARPGAFRLAMMTSVFWGSCGRNIYRSQSSSGARVSKVSSSSTNFGN